MKQILMTVIICISITFYLQAQSPWQTNINGDDIYYNEGKVGIGIDSPKHLLDITGNYGSGLVEDRQFISLTNEDNSNYSSVSIVCKAGIGEDKSTGAFGVGGYNYNAIEDLNIGGYTYLLSTSEGVALRAQDSYGHIKFITGGVTEKMRITHEGFVGIGEPKPKELVHLRKRGNLFIEAGNLIIGIGSIIMHSPDGNGWIINVNNNGELVITGETKSSNSSNPIIEPNTQNYELNIFPNPAENTIKVEVNAEALIGHNIEISNINSEKLFREQLNSSSKEINISSYPSGTYILQITNINGNVLKSKKFIKK